MYAPWNQSTPIWWVTMTLFIGTPIEHNHKEPTLPDLGHCPVSVHRTWVMFPDKKFHLLDIDIATARAHQWPCMIWPTGEEQC